MRWRHDGLGEVPNCCTNFYRCGERCAAVLQWGFKVLIGALARMRRVLGRCWVAAVSENGGLGL